ncbi:MAG: DNA translocase FtsK 4TM domain-containing protein [Alistipes sp.]|nr:DNA translocase FtsK 4TM domain-containing protein [Alistipes sp.]
MAVSKSKNKSASTSKDRSAQRSNRDSFRWVAGLILIFAGVFIAASVLFSFFCWAEDQSVLNLSEQARADANMGVSNPCGLAGAKLGYWLVDRGFGLFVILLPVLLSLLGVRVIRQKSLWANHVALSMILVTLLGSLTLGFCFGESAWRFCSSSGAGGALGNAMADLLSGAIGGFGTVIALLCGWILTGVFINRSFIDVVNRAGGAVVDQGGKLVDRVLHHEEATAPVEESEVEQPQPEPMTEPIAVEEPAIDQEPEPQEEPQQVVMDQPLEDEDPFQEIDLGSKEDRLVMGKDGVVTLEPRRTPRRVVREEPDSPFTIIDLKKLTEEKHEPQEQPQETIVEPIVLEEPTVLDDPTEPMTPAEPEPPTQPLPPIEESEEEAGLVMEVTTPQADQEASKSELKSELYDPTKDLLTYRKPPVTLLREYETTSEVSSEELFENKERIKKTLSDFGIEIQKITATVGPTVTLYEIIQAQGVKISKIQGLEQDIAQSLKALGIRIIAPIPGKGTIGIEVPNQHKQIVSMSSAIRSKRFFEFAQKAELPVVIGRTIQNENFCFDLAKLPHLLVAGATGQGKSVGLNAIISSLLYHKHPSQLKFVMVDPKMVEFSVYDRLEHHFLAKMESEDRAIITDPMKAVYTLNSLCAEMERRLELLSKATTRNIVEYNNKFVQRRLNPEKGHQYMPYIVVVIDEFADLIMMAKEVERPVMRLAQKARAVGIHLIIATQRPDVKVITGGIKANFPSRIAFRVMQMVDSRTILDQPGANQLIGRGDMLFSKDGEVTRIQCSLIEMEEVESIVDFVAKQQGYTEPYPLPDYVPEGDGGGMGSEEADLAPKKYDALFAEIARDAVQSGSISTSMIQRNYEVGFNRAGRIMMQLERAGIVGRQQGAKPRDVLFHDPQSLEAKLQDLGVF